MSEYQYYEFAAIDRSLSQAEMAHLRAVSTRAMITPASFVNHYQWGNLKANPSDWMRRYFDAFVYSANWCSCQLALRIPLTTFRKAELEPYESACTLSIDESQTHWIFNWHLNESLDDTRFAIDDGSGWMIRLVPLREELLRGDLRPLYLGWLAGAVEEDDTVLEPEVPPGLADLSPAQQALMEFLEINPDLLAAAAIGSADVSSAGANEHRHVNAWLETCSDADMKAVFKQIATGKGREAERWVHSHYNAWLHTQRPTLPSNAPRRTVAELYVLAEAAAVQRQEREAQAAKERAAEQQRLREAHLRQIMAEARTHWEAADAHARRGGASGYDQARTIIGELADGYALTSSHAAFERDLQQFLTPHSKRRALVRRLAEAGLCK